MGALELRMFSKNLCLVGLLNQICNISISRSRILRKKNFQPESYPD